MLQSLHILRVDLQWMAYNLVLAMIPFVLAAVLARPPRRRELVAWALLLGAGVVGLLVGPQVDTARTVGGLVGVLGFVALLVHWGAPRPVRRVVQVVGWVLVVAFLPNAPYVWTDGLHLVHDLAVTHARPVALAVLLPAYALYTVVGFLPYVLTVLLLERRAIEAGRARWVTPLRLLQYLPVGFGVYLGRIERFNSWNPFLHPGPLVHTIRVQAHSGRVWAFTLLTIAILAATTEVGRAVLVRATSKRTSPDAAHHLDERRLVVFVVAASAYVAGALLATAYVPAAVLGDVHAPGWGTVRVTAAVAAGVALSGAATLAYRGVAMRRERLRGAWTTVGALTLAAPYVGACVMLMFAALWWAIHGGVPRYLGPGRFG